MPGNYGVARTNFRTLGNRAFFNPMGILGGPIGWADQRDAVWNGSNQLTSIVNRGTAGGSFAITGVPVKGQTIRGGSSIRTTSGQYLTITLPSFSSGSMSYFWYGALNTVAGDNGIFSVNWSGGPNAKAIYVNATGGAFNFGNGFPIDAGHAPGFQSSGNVSDTALHTVAGVLGPTNAHYIDKASQGFVSQFGGTFPTASLAWVFLTAFLTGENVEGDTFGLMMFDGALTQSNVDYLNDGFTTL